MDHHRQCATPLDEQQLVQDFRDAAPEVAAAAFRMLAVSALISRANRCDSDSPVICAADDE